MRVIQVNYLKVLIKPLEYQELSAIKILKSSKIQCFLNSFISSERLSSFCCVLFDSSRCNVSADPFTGSKIVDGERRRLIIRPNL